MSHNELAAVIPSKTPANLRACMDAVRRQDRCVRLMPVYDAADWSGIPEYFQGFGTLGEMPFIYSRNCNHGIRAAENSDVILLNDDALLQTPGGFTGMQQEAEKYPEFGLIAATCNNVGNVNQWPRGIGLREDRMVCFVCVLIPRRTIEKVGLLDERFTAYGWEDNDYCRRVREAGLKIGIFDGCYVDHASLTSTFRGPAGAGGDIRPGAEIYRQKWGDLQ